MFHSLVTFRLSLKWNPAYHFYFLFYYYYYYLAADQAAIFLKVSRPQRQLSDTFLSTEQLLWHQSARVANPFDGGLSSPALTEGAKPPNVRKLPGPPP